MQTYKVFYTYLKGVHMYVYAQYVCICSEQSIAYFSRGPDEENTPSLSYSRGKKSTKKAGEMVQWLGAPVALADDPGVAPSTHIDA